MTRPFLALAMSLAAFAAQGCHSADSGTIQIITDEEAGTFTRNPAPTELQIAAVESADASTVLATAQLPTSTIDLGQQSESAPVVSLNVTGFDASKARRVFGATLPVQYSALVGQTIPIFVQRTGELARLPGPLSDSRHAPVLSVIQGEFLLVAGGSDPSLATTTQIFDFGGFTALGAPPSLPAVAQSMALSGTVAWLINATGSMYFDFSGIYAPSAIAAPAGGSFADVAGGATVIDPHGAQYIVGGTRTSGMSAMVLKIDPNDLTNTNYPFGNATWLRLTTARRGAGASWVGARGLVVAGGNVDLTGPGAEIVSPDFSGSSAFPCPADESIGVGAAALDGQHVLLAGGVSPSFQDPGVRVLDLECTPSTSTTCVATWAALPFGLAGAQTFAWTASDGLVVGNEFIGGKTHVFRVSPTHATEVPTRVPHVDARAVWSPVGTVVLFGGANAIESFVP